MTGKKLFFERIFDDLFQNQNHRLMANQFIKVDMQGIPVLINKSHIVVAKFGDASVTRIQLTSGETIEVRHTP
ncbi:MAG TPA: hypothetical protein VGH64_12740, partial [Puia sp.]